MGRPAACGRVASGSRVGLNQDWLWPVLCGVVAVACAARLTIEMRQSTLSLALLWTGGLAWLAAVICSPLTIGSLEPASQTMLVAGLALTGQWTILWAHMAYARHVLLDAHGLLAPRTIVRRPRLAKRTRKESTAAAAESSQRGNARSPLRKTAAETASAERSTGGSSSTPAKVATGAKPTVRQPRPRVKPPHRQNQSPQPPCGSASKPTTMSPTTRIPTRVSRGQNGNGSRRQQRGQVRNAA